MQQARLGLRVVGVLLSRQLSRTNNDLEPLYLGSSPVSMPVYPWIDDVREFRAESVAEPDTHIKPIVGLPLAPPD